MGINDSRPVNTHRVKDALTHDDILTQGLKFLEHYGVKGMRWGVVKDEENGVSPSGTRPVALTEKENRANPDGPDRRDLVKKAALIGGSVVLAGAVGYGAYKFHQSGLSVPNANPAEKTLQPPTSIIHLARAKNKGLTFHAKGDTPDFFGVFDKLGMNSDLDVGHFEKTPEGIVASRFLDPLGRRDFAGRPISHDVVVPASMSSNLHSTSDVVDQIWPKIKGPYQKFWDENEAPSLNHSDLEGSVMEHDDVVARGENFLEHHGVKGMKWGVHKTDSSSGPVASVVTQKKPGSKLKTSGGQGHPAHEDAKNAAENIRKAKKSRTSALSNQELQEAIKRMQLEQQFQQLSAGRQNAGKRFIKKLLGDTASQQASSVVNTQAAAEIDKQLRKHGRPVAAKSKYKD